jgi:hypothetical protein
MRSERKSNTHPTAKKEQAPRKAPFDGNKKNIEIYLGFPLIPK